MVSTLGSSGLKLELLFPNIIFTPSNQLSYGSKMFTEFGVINDIIDMIAFLILTSHFPSQMCGCKPLGTPSVCVFV